MGVSFLNMIWDPENMQIEFARSLFFFFFSLSLSLITDTFASMSLICIVIFVFLLISFIEIKYSKLVSLQCFFL